jgi:hypothetical protein
VAEARAFFYELNPQIPPDAVAAALTNHVHGTLDVIDAQAAKDVTRAYVLGRQGAMMTALDLADPIAQAILKQKPERFTGTSTGSNGARERQFSLLLQGHVFLSGAALAALVAGRTGEADAINGVVEQNTTELAVLVGGANQGGATQSQFVTLWRAQIAAFSDYARAVAANDLGGRQQAAARLDTFRADMDALLGPQGRSPGGSVGAFFVPQVAYVTAALDALGAGDVGSAKAFTGGAAKQSQEVAVRLARALGA